MRKQLDLLDIKGVVVIGEDLWMLYIAYDGELAQIAADALGAPLEAVWVRPVDTSRVPDSGPTVASRTTSASRPKRSTGSASSTSNPKAIVAASSGRKRVMG